MVKSHTLRFVVGQGLIQKPDYKSNNRSAQTPGLKTGPEFVILLAIDKNKALIL
jgi:hypothetical protein